MNFLDSRKVLLHIDKLRKLAQGEMVEPVEIEFDLTNRCNHKCKWCRYADVRDSSELSWADIQRLLFDFDAFDQKPSIVFVGGGEPTIHPRFVDAVQLGTELGLEMGVFTNGSVLNGQIAEVIGNHCRWIRVSLDAGDSLTYARGHGVSPTAFRVVCDNVREFVERHPDVPLGLTFVATDENTESLLEFLRLAGRLHPAYVQIRPDVNGGPTVRVKEVVRSHAGKANAPVLVSGTNCNSSSHCWSSPLVAVVGADCNLYRCCNYRGHDPIGSVANQPFSVAWFDEQRLADWQSFDASRCLPCRFVGYNQLVESCVLNDECHRGFL